MKTCIDTLETLRDHNLRLLLLGFPKCGTTAFAEWLSTSGAIDVSSPKETFLLCPEFAQNLERSGLKDFGLEDCFSPANDDVLRMEATTLNVYSPSLLDAAPRFDELKCIVLTRDPVQATLSWHNQVVNAGFQVDDDFMASWNAGLNNDESEGQGFLRRYQDVSSHGHWCEKWLQKLGHERCLLIRASDLKQTPDLVLRRVETFLGKKLDLPESPPVRNSYAEPRNRFVYDAIRGSKFLSVFRNVEQHMRFLASARRWVRDSVVMKPSRKEVPTDIAKLLEEAYAQDQALMTTLEQENHAVWS